MLRLLVLVLVLVSAGVRAETRTPNLNLRPTAQQLLNDNFTKIDDWAGQTRRAWGIDVRTAPYNARCDGATDDRARIQRAIDDACLSGSSVVIPAATCYSADTLTITCDNIRIVGQGDGSILKFPSSIGPYISATDVSGIHISDLRIEGAGVGTGDFGPAVQFTRVTDSAITNNTFYDPDDFGFYLIDSDRITVQRNHIIGADSRFVVGVQQPYCGVLDGTGGSTIANNTCYQVLFGMLAQSVNTEGSVSARTAQQARGNTFSGNTIDKHYSHGFSMNGIDGQTVTGNVVRNYPADGASVREAFQNKSTTPVGAISDDRTNANTFTGNVAETEHTCFGTNDGGRSIWNGNACYDAKYDGFWANGSIRDEVNGLIVRNFNSANSSRACVRIEGSANVSVTGVKCEADTAGTSTAIGVDVRSSSVNAWLDNIDLLGTYNTGLSIGSGSNNTAIGPGFRMNAATVTTAINDGTTNTIYPRSFSVQFNAADTGVHFIARPPRGLIVGRVHYAVPLVIAGGTPAIAVGQFGSNNKIVTSTALTAVTAGTVNSYDATTSPAITERNITAGGYLQANNTPNSASSGRIGVTVDGIDGPFPATTSTTSTTTTTSSTTSTT